MLPVGTNNQILKVVNGQLKWEDQAFEDLIPGSFILGLSYNTLSPRTWSVNATSSNNANTVVSRNNNGDFSAGTISANLSGNVVGNVTGNVTGNATTATRLQTARSINGVPFDGTSNITVSTNYTVTFGNTIFAGGFTNIVGSWSNNSNFFDVFPPSGKTMSNLVAFIPSIAVIHYAGNVNADDSMRCTWSNLGNRIRVFVQNTEQRSTPAANYLAIWS